MGKYERKIGDSREKTINLQNKVLLQKKLQQQVAEVVRSLDLGTTKVHLNFPDGTILTFSRTFSLKTWADQNFRQLLAVLTTIICIVPCTLFYFYNFMKRVNRPEHADAATSTELSTEPCASCGKLKKQLEEGRFNWKKAERSVKSMEEALWKAEREAVEHRERADGVREEVEKRWRKLMEERVEKEKEAWRRREGKIREQVEREWRGKVEGVEKRLQSKVAELESLELEGSEESKENKVLRAKVHSLEENLSKLNKTHSQLQKDSESSRHVDHKKIESLAQKVANISTLYKKLQMEKEEKEDEVSKLTEEISQLTIEKQKILEAQRQAAERTNGLQDQLVYLTSIRGEMMQEKPHVKAIEMARKLMEWTTDVEVEKEAMNEMNRYCLQYEVFLKAVESNIQMIQMNLDFSTADLLEIPQFPTFSPTFLKAYERIGMSELLNHTECLICLEDIEPHEKLATCQFCRRCYHGECSDRWLQESSSCPVCKNTMR